MTYSEFEKITEKFGISFDKAFGARCFIGSASLYSKKIQAHKREDLNSLYMKHEFKYVDKAIDALFEVEETV